MAVFAWLGFAVGYAVATPRDGGTDPVAVGFLQDMSSHHRQALEMSLIVLDNGETPAVRAVAREILIGQSYEIGRMEQQLRTMGQDPIDRPDVVMAWMGMPSTVAAMPGMATAGQLDALRSAQGVEADVLFVELMAAHHAGGVHMADDAARRASSPALRDLAMRMARNQRVEVQEMIALVERHELPADVTPIPPPRS
ncbi:MAG: DUF305 domain-containing protein [Actinobacteria bacterium]|nr:DUF305 domain-containing protein [Actinomycetota bacterium]